MSHAYVHGARGLAPLALLLLAVPAPRLLAANGPGYDYAEIGFAIDSTIETYGRSYDSDSSFRVDASYLLNRHLFVSARYHSGGYDFDGPDDYNLAGYSLGLGYRGRIGSDEARPVDWFAVLSYEHNRTQSEVNDVDFDTGHTGGGLRAGIRAVVTDTLELNVSAYQQSFGSEFLLTHGDLNGLSFELGAALELSKRFSVTAAYRTGELDYKFLDNFPTKYQIELDHDEVFVGFRGSFR